jgi:hypothetical protein
VSRDRTGVPIGVAGEHSRNYLYRRPKQNGSEIDGIKMLGRHAHRTCSYRNKGSDRRQEPRKQDCHLPILLKEHLASVNEDLVFVERPKLTDLTRIAIPQPKCQAVAKSRPYNHRAKYDNKIEIAGAIKALRLSMIVEPGMNVPMIGTASRNAARKSVP